MQLPDADKYSSKQYRTASRSRGFNSQRTQRDEHTQQVPGHGGSLLWRPWTLFFLAVLLVSVIRSFS